MPSKAERILEAIRAVLDTVPGARSDRNIAVPVKIPEGGLIVLRDGDPGEPGQALGGFGATYYRHAVEIEVYVEAGDAAFDALLGEIGRAFDADPTLGGLVFGMSYGRPEVMTEAPEGGTTIKTGTITLVLDYEAPSPLG